METKKITVIIPIYNGQKYLERCVSSCISSKGIDIEDLEILLLDDGSSDNSEDIGRKFAKLYPNSIKYSYHTNVGVSKTRNIGIRKATGTYFTFLDQDDYVDTDYFFTLYFNAEKHNYDITVSELKRTDETGKVIKRLSYIPFFNRKLTTLLSASCWGKLYRTTFVKNTEFEPLRIGEDIGYLASLMKMQPTIKIIHYAGYNWFYNTASVSNTQQRSLEKNAESIIALQTYLHKIDKDSPYTMCLATVFTCYGLFFAGKYDEDAVWSKHTKVVMNNLKRLYPRYRRNLTFWFLPGTFLNPLSLSSKIFVALYSLNQIALLTKLRHLAKGL